MPSHLITPIWTRNGEQIPNPAVTVTVTADGEVNADVSLAANLTDYRVDINIDVSALKSLVISCDGDITIETNSGSAADDTLTIAANKPLVWYEGCGLANPLEVDVTKFYITKGAGTSTLKVRTLQDITPA